MPTIESYLTHHFKDYVDELKSFLRYPSVSTDPKYKESIHACAEYLVSKLTRIGLKNVKRFETPGHPIVYGEWCGKPNKPTLLIYGHYDVQPPDPLSLWVTPPFEPDIRDGQIYARGVSDDKGQVFCHLKSMELLFALQKELPLNVKILIEGEEEIGSLHLPEFVKSHREMLKADAVLVSDTPMFGPDLPSLCYSLRGLIYMELRAKGAHTDLHSGQHGGAVPNPIQALASIISRLKDEHNRVTLPFFYEDVREIPEEVRKTLRALPFDELSYQKSLGLKGLEGEKGFSSLERRWFRPTLECNGILGGYTGEGAKTVIPSEAMAKISMRLVADQNPETLIHHFIEYVHRLTPSSISLETRVLSHTKAAMVNLDTPAIQAAKKALAKVYGKDPILQGEGGSIPVVVDFERILGIPTVLMGFNLPDDGIHAPNERFSLENFRRGILSSAYFFEYYAGSA